MKKNLRLLFIPLLLLSCLGGYLILTEKSDETSIVSLTINNGLNSGQHQSEPKTDAGFAREIFNHPEILDQAVVANHSASMIFPPKRILMSDRQLQLATKNDEDPQPTNTCSSMYFWEDFASVRTRHNDSLDKADVNLLMKMRQSRLQK